MKVVHPHTKARFGRTFIRCNLNSTTAETLTAANYVFYSGTEAEIVIPDGVTSIARGAFMFNTTITSVTIPDGVVEI